MVFPIIAFAAIFQDAGLNLAVVQRERLSEGELSTVFFINAALGLRWSCSSWGRSGRRAH
jgi:hypothetical protein